jgi:hypothetical protein
MPFCLWEVRMSPSLHYGVYGFRAENFTTMVRFGGFRPSVFMQSGLAVAMLMAVGTLAAFWLSRTGARRTLGGVSLRWLCVLLLATTILCKSTGALMLLVLGIAVLEGTRLLRGSALIVIVALVPPAYCVARISGWSVDPVVQLAANVVNDERAESVRFRFDNERLLTDRAKIRPWLGWGRFGRSFVYGEEGERLTVIDSMWIILRLRRPSRLDRPRGNAGDSSSRAVPHDSDAILGSPAHGRRSHPCRCAASLGARQSAQRDDDAHLPGNRRSVGLFDPGGENG